MYQRLVYCNARISAKWFVDMGFGLSETGRKSVAACNLRRLVSMQFPLSVDTAQSFSACIVLSSSLVAYNVDLWSLA